ncbi:MAG TPA: recombinase family protein, partial [Myxococcota bacterium]|nr:recombinase family protein [Myxococcota bacterium]
MTEAAPTVRAADESRHLRPHEHRQAVGRLADGSDCQCRAFAAARGWTLVDVVEEPAVSGASRHNRPGLLGLFARIDAWDVLLAWDFSRLTRDTEDLGWIGNRCQEAGTTVFDVLSGRDIFDLGSQVTGVLNAFERHKIAENTRRGLRGQAERGFATGGAPYGYAITEEKRLVI